MPGFTSVQLEPDEKMVFGPVTTTKSVSIGATPPNQGMGTASVGEAATSQRLTHTSGRTIGVTTQRVIVEDLKDPDKTQVIPNDQV